VCPARLDGPTGTREVASEASVHMRRPSGLASRAMAIWVSAASSGQPLLGPFLLSIAAGVVVAGVIAAIGVTVYVLTGRRRVKSFFGIGESNRIVVYVSRLRIDAFGSKDLEGVS
jgi:hypothetical protein